MSVLHVHKVLEVQDVTYLYVLEDYQIQLLYAPEEELVFLQMFVVHVLLVGVDHNATFRSVMVSWQTLHPQFVLEEELASLQMFAQVV